jgi:hypothetical protein
MTTKLFIEAGHDFQNGTFTRAIRTDNADFSTGIKTQIDVFKNLSGAVKFVKTQHCKNVFFSHSPTSR